MDLEQREYRKQWGQLIVLTIAHFVLDSFPGLMHTVLPAIQKSFGMTVASGGVLLTVFLVTANGIQVVIGHLRAEKDKPLFLYAGMLLTCTILLFAIVSPERMPLLWLSIISVACGAGVGMTHPEGLRAIHCLDRISSTVSSAVFMAGGVIGFAVSGWTTTIMYERWGFASLIPVCVAAVLSMLLMMAFRIRLAVERDEATRKAALTNREPISFWMIMLIATLSASSATIMGWLIPQRFAELGAQLSDGGLGVSMFSLAGGVGGIVMARLAARRGEMATIRWMLPAGVPFIIAFLFLMEHRWAMALIFTGGFFCFGSYPIMVSLARHCDGPSLGRRMGLIVGGIWLAACTLPMILGPAVEHFGTGAIILCTPIGFVLSWVLVVKAKYENRNPKSETNSNEQNTKKQPGTIWSKLFCTSIDWDDEGFFCVVKFMFIKIKSRWKCRWDRVIEITAEECMHGLSLRFKTNDAKDAYVSESIFGDLGDFVCELKNKFKGFNRENHIGTTDEWDDIYLCWKTTDKINRDLIDD